MNVTITQLPTAGPITGTESVPIVQNGQTVQTTTAAIAASPSQTQTFLTVVQEPTLPNSRYMGAGTGIGLSDGGAQGLFNISLNGASASLEAAFNGIVVKTGATTVTNRFLTAGTSGISIANGGGVVGNPTFSLTGNVLSLANMAGPGLVVSVGFGTLTPRVITGVSDQTLVTDGNGVGGNPTVGLADNPVLPGTAAMTVPVGTSAEYPAVPTPGMIRFNTDLSHFEFYESGSWVVAPVGVVQTDEGGTGLTAYTAGDMVYYASGTSFNKLALGTAGYFMVAGASAPEYQDPATLTVGDATNAANVTVAADTTNADFYLTFVSATSGDEPVKVNSGVTVNPSTSAITGGITGGTF